MDTRMRVAALVVALLIAAPILLLVLRLSIAGVVVVCLVGVAVTLGRWWIAGRRRGAPR